MIRNNDIYSTALGLIGIQPSDMNTADYEERAPYIIASFCCLAKELDKRIRRREELFPQEEFSPVFLGLEREFPLCDTLTAVASLYVAAMLVAEENQTLSDLLYAKYCDSISNIENAFGMDSCAVCESIIDKYFFD